MTLLVSSHILAELDAYSTHMLVLRDGRIVSHEPLAGPGVRAAERVPVVIALARAFPGLVDLLSGVEEVSAIRVEGLTATVELPADQDARHRVLRTLVEAGAAVCAFEPERRSMKDAYLATLPPPLEVSR
jgi:ABC-2 type transport system ATP-binding protein